MSQIDLEASGPTSRIYFSQRLRLHYVDWGNPSAPPLLLVHGGRDHCRNWDWVATRLRQHWHMKFHKDARNVWLRALVGELFNATTDEWQPLQAKAAADVVGR